MERIAENTDLKTVVHQLSSDAKTFEGQIESLLRFIDELENNNKDLVRYIDDKNYQAAALYKSKVTEILAKPRDRLGQKQNELQQHSNQIQQPSKEKNYSHSPNNRNCAPVSITPVTLENMSPMDGAPEL